MEPRFLDELPDRFRKRYRENIVVVAVIVALFVVPPRCGPYAKVAFFTIVWLANSAFYLARLLQSRPRPAPLAFILFGLMTLLFAYPIAVGWQLRRFDGLGAFALFSGVLVLLMLATIYRRLFFPSLFGRERTNIASDFHEARAAQMRAQTPNSSPVTSVDSPKDVS